MNIYEFYKNSLRNENLKSLLKILLKGIFEIALISIGIFIGLQANKKKEKQDKEKTEIEILYSIKEDLLQSKIQIVENLNFNIFTVQKISEIQEYAIDPQSLENNLEFITEWQTPYLTTVSYNSLKNSDFVLIQNKDLKKEIIQIHEMDFEYLIKDYDRIESRFSENIVWPMLMKKMKPNEAKNGNFTAINYANLKQDHEFNMMLQFLIKLRKKGISTLKVIDRNISRVIEDINSEINIREKLFKK